MQNTDSKSSHNKSDQQKENENILAAHKEADKDIEQDPDLSPKPAPAMTWMKVSWQDLKVKNNMIKL